MKSMEHTWGELLPVFGAAVVAFTFSLAAAFGWPWWGLLVAVAAVATVISLCGSTAKNMIVGGCASLFLAAAALGLVAGRASIPSVLSSAEGFLANHATAAQAVAAIVMALFTAALWWATRVQARATKEATALSERLARAEVVPLLYAPKVEIYLQENDPITLPSGEVVYRPEELEMGFFELTNVGKYGLVVRGVEILVSSPGGYQCVAKKEVNHILLSGKKKNLTLGFRGYRRPANWYQDDIGKERVPSKFHDFIEGLRGGEADSIVRFAIFYGGAPYEEKHVCFRIGRATDVTQKDIRSGSGEVLTLLPVRCPESIHPCGEVLEEE